MTHARKRLAMTMFMMALTLVLLTGVSEAAVLGQVDDFEDLTTQGWTGAADFFVNEASGGPNGADDAYLKVTGTGESGPGSRISVRNDAQWTGDYLVAGIDSISVDMANFGANELEMRVQLWGANGDVWTSTVAELVPADGMWRNFIFELTASSLTRTAGDAGTAEDLLSGLSRFQFRHQSGPPVGPTQGTPFAGVLGIDNITAVPGPAALAVVLVGGMLGPRRRRRA